jgi:glycosyltransferase involved in cell wall biosynthesis
VARYLRASDASLVSLADRPELAKFIPSKLYDYCAVGRPVILSAAGEARSLATDADAAYAVDPGDAAGLADAVRALRADPALRERLSERGRSFAAGFLREAQVERLDELLQDVVRNA